mgnify:FL=1
MKKELFEKKVVLMLVDISNGMNEEELVEVYGVENVRKYIEYSEENGWVK